MTEQEIWKSILFYLWGTSPTFMDEVRCTYPKLNKNMTTLYDFSPSSVRWDWLEDTISDNMWEHLNAEFPSIAMYRLLYV